MENFWRYKIDHVLFWVATVGFHVYTRIYLLDEVGAGPFIVEIVLRNALLALTIYLNIFLLIPKFAQQGRWFSYICLLLVDLALYVVSKSVHDAYLYGHLMNDASKAGILSNSYYNFSIAVFYMCFAVALLLSREWYEQRELIRRIEVEKLNTELDYLKAQINPHFLFNCINTIYFQIEKSNHQARTTLSAFSDMLRYQLYECNGKLIAIEKEVEYIVNYVNLQRMRKDKNYDISIDIGNVAGFKIAPLLLIPFIENAFKHVSHRSVGNEVRITLKTNDDRFQFSVFNTCDNALPSNDNYGIGLKNVQRRLQLLYNGNHQLKFTKLEDSFRVDLDIKITTG